MLVVKGKTVVGAGTTSCGILFPGFVISELTRTNVFVMLFELGAFDDLSTAFAVFFLQRTIAVVNGSPGFTGLLPGATVLRRAQG